jgi:hypothetical protein
MTNERPMTNEEIKEFEAQLPAGFDKLSRDEQLAWCEARMEDLRRDATRKTQQADLLESLEGYLKPFWLTMPKGPETPMGEVIAEARRQHPEHFLPDGSLQIPGGQLIRSPNPPEAPRANDPAFRNHPLRFWAVKHVNITLSGRESISKRQVRDYLREAFAPSEADLYDAVEYAFKRFE